MTESSATSALFLSVSFKVRENCSFSAVRKHSRYLRVKKSGMSPRSTLSFLPKNTEAEGLNDPFRSLVQSVMSPKMQRAPEQGSLLQVLV